MRSLLAILPFVLACHHAAKPATPKTPPDGQVHRFDIGALHALALKDGRIVEANDGKTFGLGHTPAEVSALFGHDVGSIELSIQPLLVRDGDRTFLFDTGALRPDWAPEAGALMASLHLGGVEPAAVTDIFVSHHHGDHVGGLLTKSGALAFPNATIHLSTPEWEAMKATKDAGDLVPAITPKVVPFAPGAMLFPSVTAVPVEGHTPGHSAYRITSGSESLLYIGDTAHSSVVSVRRPDWPVDYDTNKDLARASRRTLLERSAAEHTHLYGVHFPFPGTGYITKTDDGFTYVPDPAK